MTTRAELRTRVRQELNDTGATALWADGLLNQWLVEALRELGRQVGLEKETVLSSVAGQTSYALPADTLRVTRVEHPTGCYRVPAAFRAGDRAPGPDGFFGEPWSREVGLGPSELLFDVWAGSLVLSPAPAVDGETIGVRYVGAYAEPTTDGSLLDVPARDEDYLVFAVGARATWWIHNDEAKRMRFERDRGASPSETAREFERRCRELVRQRQGQVAARRLGIR